VVFDETRVDDVVQQTWLAALERPPRDRSGLRAWLGRVARNFALRASRDEGRRSRRERRAAKPETTPPTVDVVGELAAHRRVVHAVLALQEPYRTTILLRFYKDLPPREIARTMDVPGPTVRTRLRRALDLLRDRFDKEHDGDRRAWCLALLPLAKPRLDPPPVPPWIPATLALAAAGGIVAGTVLLVSRHDGEPDTPHAPRAAAQPVAEHRTVPPEDNVAPQPEPGTARAPAGALAIHDGEARPRTLEGVVLRGDRPVSSGRAYLLRYRSWRALSVPWHHEDKVVRTHIDADGAFRFADLEPGTYAVGVEIGGALVREAFHWVGPDRPTRRMVFVLGSARIQGQVFDDVGRAVVGAKVYVSSAKESLDGYRQNTWAETGPDGAYVIEGLPAAGYWVGAQVSGNARGNDNGLTRRIEVAEGAKAILNLGRVQPLPSWSGVVRTRAGEPVRGPGRIQLNTLGTSGYSYLAFDAEGRFRGPVLPDTYGLHLHLPGVRFLEAASVDVPETDFWHDIVVPGARVRGRVAGARGELRVRLVPLDTRPEEWFRGVPVQQDGAFVIDGVPAGRYRIECIPAMKIRNVTEIVIEAQDEERALDIEVEAK
jgi:RNA polymerase sigma-70 factor (ECF subfamily)